MWALPMILCAAAPQSIPGYDFSRPTASLRLHPDLQEVSGLTDRDGETFVCVQDELGILFVVDLDSGDVRERRPFAGPGDYEGVTRVGADYWVLQSDGKLLRVVPRDGGQAVAETIDLGLAHDDIEGLGYDARSRRLLIAPKDRAQDRPDWCPVFAFDPERRELREEPVLELSREQLVADAQELGVELPTRSTKKGKSKVDLKLRPSSIAVHPVSQDIWLLSAVDQLLLVVTRSGELVGMHFFGDRLPKPEGLTFLPGGDVLISSEGVEDERAVVQRFAYVGAREQDARR